MTSKGIEHISGRKVHLGLYGKLDYMRLWPYFMGLFSKHNIRLTFSGDSWQATEAWILLLLPLRYSMCLHWPCLELCHDSTHIIPFQLPGWPIWKFFELTSMKNFLKFFFYFCNENVKHFGGLHWYLYKEKDECFGIMPGFIDVLGSHQNSCLNTNPNTYLALSSYCIKPILNSQSDVILITFSLCSYSSHEGF